MKVGIIVFSKPDVGLGHWHRCLALYQQLDEMGHIPFLFTNVMAHGKNYFQIRISSPIDLKHALDQVRPDYLVFDLQGIVPDYMYSLADEFGVKTVLLNGVGRERDGESDLVIIQGFTDLTGDNVYSGPEYVILRPELFELHDKINIPIPPDQLPWFVFGGAKDRMGLLKTMQLTKFSSNLVMTEYYRGESLFINDKDNVFVTKDREIFPLMAMSKQACVAMGMIVWELIALGVPCYVFSATEGHLVFAKRMQEHGLVRCWDGIGLPEEIEEIEHFLDEGFEIWPDPDTKIPDEFGAKRVVELMEISL